MKKVSYTLVQGGSNASHFALHATFCLKCMTVAFLLNILLSIIQLLGVIYIYEIKVIILSLKVMSISSFPEFVEVELLGLGSLKRRCECITYFGSLDNLGLIFLFVWLGTFCFSLSLVSCGTLSLRFLCYLVYGFLH